MSGNNDSNDEHQVTRRQVLQTLGAGSIMFSAGVASSDEDTIRIPVGNLKGETIYREVPADWWDHVQHVESVQAKRNVGSKAIATSICAGTNMVHGQKKLNLKMYYEPDLSEDDADDIFPDSVDGIPVQTEKADPDKIEDGNCPLKKTFDPMVGGMDGVGGTLCCRAYSMVHDEWVMVMTTHQISSRDNICNDSLGGDDIYYDGKKMGEVLDWKGKYDWAAISEDGLDYSGDLVTEIEPSIQKEPINGEWTNYSYLLSKSLPVVKIGGSTNREYGPILEYNYTRPKPGSCNDLENEGIKISMDAAKGDSGGPIYYNADGNIMLIGMMVGLKGNRVDDSECDDKKTRENAEAISSEYLLTEAELQFQQNKS
jgi:hypothetical protein